MPPSPHSPIFRFLTKQENLSAVLEVVHHAEEIREYAADRFWSSMEEAIKNSPKASLKFSWERTVVNKSDGCFSLIARIPAFEKKKGQSLNYEIESHTEYFGIGLSWHERTKGFEKLCQLAPLKKLQRQLVKDRQGDIESEPNESWLWWEYWMRNPYTDPWSWFVSDFKKDWFNECAGNFWGFVQSIHELVLESNEALKRRRA
jgi:hypothetical protein